MAVGRITKTDNRLIRRATFFCYFYVSVSNSFDPIYDNVAQLSLYKTVVQYYFVISYNVHETYFERFKLNMLFEYKHIVTYLVK